MGDNYDTEWIHLNNDLQNEYNEPYINFKQGGYVISMGFNILRHTYNFI